MGKLTFNGQAEPAPSIVIESDGLDNHVKSQVRTL